MSKPINTIDQDRLEYQKEIVKKHGLAAVAAAEHQFCLVCSRHHNFMRKGKECLLTPLRMSGERCPYYSLERDTFYLERDTPTQRINTYNAMRVQNKLK